LEEGQRYELAIVLPNLIRVQGSSTDNVVHDVLSQLAQLGQLIGDADMRRDMVVRKSEMSMSVKVEVVAGTEVITAIEIEARIAQSSSTLTTPAYPLASNAGVSVSQQRGAARTACPMFTQAALNLNFLTPLASSLPYLTHFSCVLCSGSINPADRTLPTYLPVVAKHMVELDLPYCSLVGSVPSEWGNWTSIQQLDLSGNCLTGTLPASFAKLPSLSYLSLGGNRLTGTLPAGWGLTKVLPTSLHLSMNDNRGIRGTIPPSWAHFSLGSLSLYGTSTNLIHLT
jgi:hypothetical protein